MVALSSQQTSGRSGREIVSLVFERLAESLANAYSPRINGETVAERLQQAIDVLADEGLIFDAVPTDEGFLLKGQECPCRRVSGGEDICAHDARLLSRLLNTEVESVSAPDGWSCAYEVKLDAHTGFAGRE
jgi:predicted ArsR family transcriptional regulator